MPGAMAASRDPAQLVTSLHEGDRGALAANDPYRERGERRLQGENDRCVLRSRERKAKPDEQVEAGDADQAIKGRLAEPAVKAQRLASLHGRQQQYEKQHSDRIAHRT